MTFFRISRNCTCEAVGLSGRTVKMPYFLAIREGMGIRFQSRRGWPDSGHGLISWMLYALFLAAAAAAIIPPHASPHRTLHRNFVPQLPLTPPQMAPHSRQEPPH
jgi:hypothetical protein